MYHKLLKMYILILHTALRPKWRGSVCSNISLVLCTLPPVLRDVMRKVDNHDDCYFFWKNCSFPEHDYGKPEYIIMLIVSPKALTQTLPSVVTVDNPTYVHTESKENLGNGQQAILQRFCVYMF